MKKIIITILFTLSMSSQLMADFMRLEAGAGVWMNTANGEKTYSQDGATGTDKSLEKENTNPYIWALIKHPIPIIPNLRLEYVDVSTSGVANGVFENFVAADSSTQLDMTQYDIIPYYNILDNTAWVTLDLGIDFKTVEVDYRADDIELTGSISTGTYQDSATVLLPLLYVRTRVEIPATNIGLEADVKYISYSGDTVYDIRAKIDYTLDFLVLEPAIEVGYRTQKYDIDDKDIDGKIFLEFSGLYAGAMIRF